MDQKISKHGNMNLNYTKRKILCTVPTNIRNTEEEKSKYKITQRWEFLYKCSKYELNESAWIHWKIVSNCLDLLSWVIFHPVQCGLLVSVVIIMLIDVCEKTD